MKVNQRIYNLSKIILHLNFSQSLASFDELIEGLIGADFQENINILMVLEDMLKLDNMLMTKRLMNFDFCNKLGRCIFLLFVWLLND